jgi:hypothetical protein
VIWLKKTADEIAADAEAKYIREGRAAYAYHADWAEALADEWARNNPEAAAALALEVAEEQMRADDESDRFDRAAEYRAEGVTRD